MSANLKLASRDGERIRGMAHLTSRGQGRNEQGNSDRQFLHENPFETLDVFPGAP